jgi:site-specific recombinase XerD
MQPSGKEKVDELWLSAAFIMYCRDVIVFRNQSAKTEEAHNVALKSLITFLGGDIELSALTFDVVREWKISLEKRNLNPETIRGYLIKVRVVLNYMRLKGSDCLDPSEIPLPMRRQSVPHVLSPLEVQKLIDALDKYKRSNKLNKLRNKAIISLLYSTGLRVNELCGLNRSDISEDYFTVIGKGGKSRICFIDARSRFLLRDYISQRKDNDPALFVSSLNHRVHPGNVQEVFKYARAKAGFDWPIHPHTMRHSFATNLLKNGASIRHIQLMMGHSSLDTTQIYLKIYDIDIIKAYRDFHTV